MSLYLIFVVNLVWFGQGCFGLNNFGIFSINLLWFDKVWFGLLKFGLVWSIHRQTNKLNNYLISINLICEFVCGFCGHTKKERKKQTGLKSCCATQNKHIFCLKDWYRTTFALFITLSMAIIKRKVIMLNPDESLLILGRKLTHKNCLYKVQN